MTKKETAATSDRLFYSEDGTPIRVTTPDGGVALIGKKPRPLPKKFHRSALREGARTTDMPAKEELEDGIGKGDDPFERRKAIKEAMVDAMEAHDTADENGTKVRAEYEEAFTKADVPSVIWLKNRVGFGVDGAERDELWAEIQSELEAEGEEPEEGEEEGSE
jgi:hypothetical protein